MRVTKHSFCSAVPTWHSSSGGLRSTFLEARTTFRAHGWIVLSANQVVSDVWAEFWTGGRGVKTMDPEANSTCQPFPSINILQGEADSNSVPGAVFVSMHCSICTSCCGIVARRNRWRRREREHICYMIKKRET